MKKKQIYGAIEISRKGDFCRGHRLRRAGGAT